MPKLNERVRRLEQAAAHVDLEAMSDAELTAYASAHWVAPPWGSRESMAAVLTMVLRRPSTLPIVPTHLLLPDDTDYRPRYANQGANYDKP
jgi:hypothetical protein